MCIQCLYIYIINTFYTHCIKILFFYHPSLPFSAITVAWAALQSSWSNSRHPADTHPVMSWILRNSRFLRVARAMSWVSFLCFSRQPQAHQAAVLEIQLLEQLQAPCFTVAGKRQKACGGAELTVSKGHAAHTSPLGEAPAAGNEAAVIHCGPGVVWGQNHQCMGRGNAYVNLTTTGTGCDWRGSACCMPPGGTRWYGGQTWGFSVAPSQHEGCWKTALRGNPCVFTLHCLEPKRLYSCLMGMKPVG